MKWRVSLLLVVFAGLGAGYWWINGVMATQGWAEIIDGKWRINASGWETLKYAWPVTIVGLLIGGAIAFLFIIYCLAEATDADHQDEIDIIKAHKAASDEDAAQAQNRADRFIKSEQEKLRIYEKKLKEKEERLKSHEAEVVRRIQSAEKRANDAEKKMAFANTKKERATYALSKYKRKHSKQ